MDRVTPGQALCRLDDIPANEAIAVDATIDGELDSLILTRQGESVRAYFNICPHAGRRLDWAPGKFLMKDGLLICAAHGASFQAVDGFCIGGPCRGASLRAVPVEVTEGAVVLARQGA
ncbi:Rieske (2Fe-2S) protein [Dyella sp.]|uniref:Rieske (2Fe-2S) protein n=1 Tax=Dyella sp. TaxID=1869338 RepID=UPI002ED04D78